MTEKKLGGREFVDLQGNPEDPAWTLSHQAAREVGERRQAAREMGQHKPLEGESLFDAKEYWEQLLPTINFAVLRSVIGRQAERSGVERPRVNFVTAEQIVLMQGVLNPIGCYDPEANLIFLDIKKLVERARRLGLDERLSILSTLGHEEIHAADRVECRGLRASEEAEARQEMAESEMSGGLTSVHRLKKPGAWFSQSRTQFMAFNEGRVQTLAMEVLRDYLSRDYDFTTPEAVARFFKRQKEVESEMPYAREVKLVARVVAQVAKALGVPRATVWQGVVASGFRGEPLDEVEMQASLEEIFFPQFVNQLAKVNSKSDIEALLRGYSNQ